MVYLETIMEPFGAVYKWGNLVRFVYIYCSQQSHVDLSAKTGEKTHGGLIVSRCYKLCNQTAALN